MPISWSSKQGRECWDGVKRNIRAEMERWDNLTPEQQETEKEIAEARWEKARKHIKWLDWCAANKVDPNLVK